MGKHAFGDRSALRIPACGSRHSLPHPVDRGTRVGGQCRPREPCSGFVPYVSVTSLRLLLYITLTRSSSQTMAEGQVPEVQVLLTVPNTLTSLMF